MSNQVEHVSACHTLATSRGLLTVLTSRKSRTRLLPVEANVDSHSSRSVLLSDFGDRVEMTSTRSEIINLRFGAARAALDDRLYDEIVDRQIYAADLLLALTRMSAYPFSHMAEVWNLNPGSVDHEVVFPTFRKYIPVESDPSKVRGNEWDRKTEPQDLPAEERRNWRPFAAFQGLSDA